MVRRCINVDPLIFREAAGELHRPWLWHFMGKSTGPHSSSICVLLREQNSLPELKPQFPYMFGLGCSRDEQGTAAIAA